MLAINKKIKINEIIAASIVTPSKLPSSDFVINPYVGCMHACKYCYANFMKKFSGHKFEGWGSFVDVKINALEKIKLKRDAKKLTITVSSVTDPYQSIEAKYKLTRGILEKLLDYQPQLCIITKSFLVTRDIPIIKQFKDCEVAISLSLLDDSVRKVLEPRASSVASRINAIKLLKDSGIRVVLFVSPILPYLTDWAAIIDKTKGFVDEYWFENLNMYASIKRDMYASLYKIDKSLVQKYIKIFAKNSIYWLEEEKQLTEYASKQGIVFRLFFHHAPMNHH